MHRLNESVVCEFLMHPSVSRLPQGNRCLHEMSSYVLIRQRGRPSSHHLDAFERQFSQ